MACLLGRSLPRLAVRRVVLDELLDGGHPDGLLEHHEALDVLAARVGGDFVLSHEVGHVVLVGPLERGDSVGLEAGEAVGAGSHGFGGAPGVAPGK